jgi:hypothetical protein
MLFQSRLRSDGERFAYLDLDGAQVMLEERARGRNWVTGPLGSFSR